MPAQLLADPIAREDRLFCLRDDSPASHKTLYLPAKADEPVLVKASQTSLIARLHSGRTLSFPYARIGRIIASPYVHWQGSALTRTLAHGITITWADGNGHYVGCAEPRRNGHFDTNSRIELYLETPRWRQQFENWHCRRRLEVLRTTRERADAWGRPVDPQVLEQRKRAFVHRGEVETTLDGTAHAECRSWVARFLHHNELRQRYFGFDGDALDLGEEFTTLMWAEFNYDCGSLANSALHSGTLRMHWFETWTRRREHRLPMHLGDFKRHIAQVLSSPW